jgi:hypothetical protein
MVNEAHSGACARPHSQIGLRLLPVAGSASAIAMEALWDRELAEHAKRASDCCPGRRATPGNRGAVVQVHSTRLASFYGEMDGADADPMSTEATNWREPSRRGTSWPPDEPLHSSGGEPPDEDRRRARGMMGLRFHELSGIEPFALDQTATVFYARRN